MPAPTRVLLWWRLGEERVVDHDDVPPMAEKRPLPRLQLLIGDVTLVVGDAGGDVTNWFFVVPAIRERKKQAGTG